MSYSNRITVAVVVVTALLTCASTAMAQDNAPNATFLIGADVFNQGQSNNLGPAANKVLSDYWTSGACPDRSGSYADCDDLRFGLTMYPHQRRGNTCDVEYNEYVAPQEDGGGDVESDIKNMQNEVGSGICADSNDRALDEAFYDYQRHKFAGTQSDDDSPWNRANLNLVVIAELPREGGSWRVKKSLKAACDVLRGKDESGARSYPAMPT